MTELEIAAERHSKRYCSTGNEHLDNAIKDFAYNAFLEALKPEHMRLTEEVKELIAEAKDMIKYTERLLRVRDEEAIGLAECARNDLEEALKPFEKENPND